MEEIEVPIEHAQEQLHEAAHHSGQRWVGRAALASGLIAVAAAVSALMAGTHANEAMLAQIKASNSWNYYQAKGVKSSVLTSKVQIMHEMGKPEVAADSEKLETYKHEQEEISAEAKNLEAESAAHLKIHEILARAVTLFQTSIALGAISVLSRRKYIWFGSLALALVGIGFLVQGLLA